MIWNRLRIALVACAALEALAMLYVGLFQVGWVDRLACPLFGAGCESVALVPLAWPLGFADGLLAAALAGVLCALVQVERREAGAALVGLAFLNLLAYLIGLFEMQRFHAWDFWHVLSAVLSAPVAALAVVSERRGGPAPVAPGDRAQEGQ
ncbi:MAG: hypothetical protein ABR567_05040 [Myxococcales bacterium]|nr:hypothetical protein [Myxococcales bacterium]